MTPAPASPAVPGARSQAGIEERVVALANEIVDPCSAAQAVQVGLVDMGMLLQVRIEPAAALPAGGSPDGGPVRWDVTLRLRTTGPGCLYVVFFERELRQRIESQPDVASLALEWDDAWDWTPDAMAPAARDALARRRRALIALVPAGTPVRR